MQQTELLPVPLIWSLPSQATGVYLSRSWCVTEQCVSVSPNPSYKTGADFCLLDKCSLSNQNTHQGPHTAFPAVKSALVMLAWKSGRARAWETWNHLKDLNSTKGFRLLLLACNLWPEWPFGSLPLPSSSAQQGTHIPLLLPSAQLKVMPDNL